MEGGYKKSNCESPPLRAFPAPPSFPFLTNAFKASGKTNKSLPQLKKPCCIMELRKRGVMTLRFNVVFERSVDRRGEGEGQLLSFPGRHCRRGKKNRNENRLILATFYNANNEGQGGWNNRTRRSLSPPRPAPAPSPHNHANN